MSRSCQGLLAQVGNSQVQRPSEAHLGTVYGHDLGCECSKVDKNVSSEIR